MIHHGAAIGVVLVLAGCQPPLIAGGPDSKVRRLSVGMSYAQVRAVLGPQQAGDIKLDEQAESCLSWVYGEVVDPQFVHAMFRGDVLLAADDGHAGLCR